MTPNFQLIFFSQYCTCIIRSSDTVVLIKNISFITVSNFFFYRAGINSTAARCLQTVVKRSYTGVNMALSQFSETCFSYYIKNNCFFFFLYLTYLTCFYALLCTKWGWSKNDPLYIKQDKWRKIWTMSHLSLLGRAVFSPVCLVVKVCLNMWACICR